MEQMIDTNLTFGIELEFICLRKSLVPQDSTGSELPTVGESIHHAIADKAIAVTGWESLDEDISDDVPPYSQWRVEEDVLRLSQTERALLPSGWEVEEVELSSRKFNFFTDDWRGEISDVLDALRKVELQRGCRFITNQTTGFHVHVGNGSQKVPLRTAKNVFQLATAFERCIDELHTVPRISIPPNEEMNHHCYYPPSFYHACTDWEIGKTYWSSLYERLADIESIASYIELGKFFEVSREDLGLDYGISGHNSAYNFDNLFALGMGRPEETLTGTIEFRQHTGTLDYIEIVAWVVLVCQLVQYCGTATDEDMLDLCFRGADTSFRLEDFLLAFDCSEDVIDHYLHHDTIGMIGENPVDRIPEPLLDFVIDQNDDECAGRSDRAGVDAAIQGKYQSGLYGLDATIPTLDISPATAAAELEKARAVLRMTGGDLQLVEGVSEARALVLKAAGQLYSEAAASHGLLRHLHTH